MSEENQEPIDEQQEETTEPTTEEVTEEPLEETTVETEPVVEWFIQVADGKKAGPISFDRLQGFAERGKIFPKTNVRSTEADAAWQPAALVPGLFPDIDPKEFTATDSQPKEKPTSEEPEEKVTSSELSNDSAMVTDDSQATTIPKVLIDVGKKKDEKPSEKPKAKKPAAFVIDTGASSKKKEEPAETVDATPPEAEPKPEVPKAGAPKPAEEKKSGGSSVVSSPGIKISIGASAGKKEPKKEKSSAAFKFAIDPDASKKKEEKIEEKPVEPVTEPEPVKPTESEKKKDASSPGVKISIGAPAAKKKTGDKSSFVVSRSEKSSEKSEIKKSGESTVLSKKSDTKSKTKPVKQDEEDTDGSADFELKTPKTGSLGMRILGILSALLGTFGGLALGFLSYKPVGPVFGVTLAVVLAFFGVLLCLVAFLSPRETS